jgi:hypothetical protein
MSSVHAALRPDFFCCADFELRALARPLARFVPPLDELEVRADAVFFLEEADVLLGETLALDERVAVPRRADLPDSDVRLERGFEYSSTEFRLTSLLKLLALPFAVFSCTTSARLLSSNLSNHSFQLISCRESSPL